MCVVVNTKPDNLREVRVFAGGCLTVRERIAASFIKRAGKPPASPRTSRMVVGWGSRSSKVSCIARARGFYRSAPKAYRFAAAPGCRQCRFESSPSIHNCTDNLSICGIRKMALTTVPTLEPHFSVLGSRMPNGRRSDGRKHDTGTVQPYRPCPPDFRERYLEMGQSKEIEEHYRTNWRCIRRWIEESGGEELRAARREVSGGTARPRLRAKRYVLGRTLTDRRS